MGVRATLPKLSGAYTTGPDDRCLLFGCVLGSSLRPDRATDTLKEMGAQLRECQGQPDAWREWRWDSEEWALGTDSGQSLLRHFLPLELELHMAVWVWVRVGPLWVLVFLL